MKLDATWVSRWVSAAAADIAAHKSALNTLDREIGDGDHGENMDRGLQASVTAVATLPPGATPAAALRVVAMTLISTVGGAAGPLYGTAFLKAAETVGDATELDAQALVAMLTAARDGIVTRGKAEPGDKTMVDAWTPAVEATTAAVASGTSDPDALLRIAATAAAEGAVSTVPMLARKGRASYLGERSIGHRDPGAESTALILRAARGESE